MKNNKNIYLFIFFTFSIIAYILYDKNNYYNEIETNKGVAIGKVIEYQFSKNEYFVKYEYEVKNVKYFNDVSTNFFRCKDGNKGCIGEYFNVYYSELNPEKSYIDLEEYNKYKQFK